jgi:hypothetical protein
MKRFIISSDKFTGSAELLYNDKGMLIKIDMTQAQMDEHTTMHFKRSVPHTLALLMDNNWCSPGTTTVEAEYEVDFEMFWEKYDHKINKKRCIPLWDKLTKPQQVAAYYGIYRYQRYLQRTGQYKRNPENYLKDEMWNNDYK